MRLIAFKIFVLLSTLGFSQEEKPAVESFESDKTLELYKVSNGNLSISKAHRRFGETSLQWNWNNEGSFSTSNFKILSHDESPLEYGDHFPASPTLALSIYNETPKYNKITIAFEKDGVKQVWFDLELSFKGWRRIWVPFYEMQGNAPQKGASVDYDLFKVSTEANTGTLFFDDIIFSQYQDDRHQYPDMLVPFIKSDQDLSKDHWMPLISNYKRIEAVEAAPVSMAIRLDLKRFETAIDQDLTIDKKYKVYINTLRDMFNNLKLEDNGTTVLGPPLTFKEQQEYFNKKQQGAKIFNDIKDLGTVLKKLANFHDRATPAEREEIESMFLAGTKYFLDQGWQVGANGGTRHHIGYNVIELTEAFYVMRHFLYDNDLLNDVGASLHWLFNLGMILGDEKDFHVNIDYLNTQSYYHLMLIFLFDSQEKQAALLRAYSKYISIILAQQKEEWGFKVDGTAWHHNGHYPAYGIGAFKSVPKVINTLAGTRFRIATEGHANFRNAFLASRIYSQLYNWGFGNAGRHPLENNGIESLQEQFLLMANAGNPEGTSKIDEEVAAAYLRLWGKDDIMNKTIFTDVNGIHSERLDGYFIFPYAATSVQRRKDWAAIMKGYSKYVWASEIYVSENRYGRYPANGTVELLNNKGETGSGFRQEGWDWNRYPGATIIYLPLEELEAKMPLIMFRSNETFAGAAHLNGNGIFGMVLNEGKGSNADGPETKVGYPGKLKAKKSVFSFGDKLICIGTDISSIDEKNPTQTNLFQTFLEDTKSPLITSLERIKKFPYQGELNSQDSNKNWLIDPYGNGYYILSKTPVQIKKDKQQSYHNKYSVNTGNMNPKGKGAKETEGDYASAWIDHGLAPKDAAYQYVIYPFLREDEQSKFNEIVKNDTSFEIKRADSIAHIVLDKESNTMGYVVFEGNKQLENGLLKEVSTPSLIMLQEKGDKEITLSVVQPDLNFPVKENGKFENYSQPVNLILTIKGKWDVINESTVRSIDNSNENTRITLECVNGFSKGLELIKR
ncbi:chondroitinase family polysaccharide lyase [Aestuariibaculum suncheonense]|uniref:Uncharacterized protein n=1 Tax=Aestuariibaculum suncheonense TaxID=1028745 RepID=A0A8J6QUJ4_9FLAO|nr:chondroitinase family polysaccharide lyase [Aestuariibaculum suncheonense]MBD0835674.1 hypothetical protein [Aestuariibaculum suncheonense]